MLQEAKAKKIKIASIAVFLVVLLSLGAAVSAAFLNTNRDTRPVPERAKSSLEYTDAYQELCTVGDYKYLFLEEKDILAIENVNQNSKQYGWIWKTGLDIPQTDDVYDGRKYVDKVSDQLLDLAKSSGIKTGKKTDDEVMAEVLKKVEAGTARINSDEYQDLEDYAKENGMTPSELLEYVSASDSSFQSEEWIDFANSLITLNYYEGSGDSIQPKRVSSAPSGDDKSSLSVVDESKHEYKLQCEFSVGNSSEEIVGMNVYLTFEENGKVNVRIPSKEISGQTNKIKNVEIAPFLGTSGGILNYYDGKDYTIAKQKDLIPGYVLVPDGSGSLVRFTQNSATFQSYEGKVYGDDPSTAQNYYSPANNDVSLNVVPIKDPSMPVYGISQGDGTQAAFVAYADSGDEYMTVNVTPSSMEKNKIAYTYAYASFLYNSEYYQVTNQAGDAYRKIQDKMNEFDIDMTFQFLAGDGSDGTPSADYAGMAKAYRQHLIEKGQLTEIKQNKSSIPIRIDFLMSDSKKGVFSTQEVAVTTTDDVKSILNSLNHNGINNINSGLIGWQSGGETQAKPYSTSFSGKIGSEGDFEDLMAEFKERGIDISFSRDFTMINEDMISYYNNAAKHLNTQYLTLDRSEILPTNCPVTEYGYARPEKSAEWIGDLYEDLGGYSNSLTIDGVSNILLSSYTSDVNKRTSAVDAVKLYQDAIAKIKKNGTKVNLVNPNKYLWQYTDRYLQSPVGTSQYVYETDTVPFLQMVLAGTMEVYAPYANFSFYSQTDMLRMIDYNTSPSFVLTKEPSYLLAATASSDYYSTEYEQYKDLIKTIYETVNAPLSQVIGYQWDSRTVYTWNGSKLVTSHEDGENEQVGGVIANQYSKDGNVKTIIINYTDDEIQVHDTKIAAQSAAVIEGGVK